VVKIYGVFNSVNGQKPNLHLVFGPHHHKKGDDADLAEEILQKILRGSGLGYGEVAAERENESFHEKNLLVMGRGVGGLLDTYKSSSTSAWYLDKDAASFAITCTYCNWVGFP
jgi:hypothetical protein